MNMDGDMEDLGRRAVACKGWRWMQGMLRLTDKDDALPDLADPATLGCLLALVREAWSNPDLHFRPATAPPDMGGVRRWLVCGSRWAFMGAKTEAEAMVRALESKAKR